MENELEAILAAFRADLQNAADPQAIAEVKRIHTGRKSQIKGALRGLRTVAPEDRPRVAQRIQQVSEQIVAEVEAAEQEIVARAEQARLDAEWMDLSMPGVAVRSGARHPLSIVEDRCAEVLRQLGFELRDGPEVEDPFYNFDALNIPEHHPARDMQDTFWVDGGKLLRSHTTTVQARVLESRPPLPIRVFSKGRVYRNEAVDANHLAMFHQFEGIWVDKGLTFAHLKGLLKAIVRGIYGDHPIRFKPKFYPYTEPSAGIDLQTPDGGWVTIVGSGMIHPKVFQTFGYDPNEVSGIAFGFGTSRMAMEYSGARNLIQLYNQDLRVLEPLHRGER